MKSLQVLFLLLSSFMTFSLSAQDISAATPTEKKLAAINVEGWQNKLILNVKQKEKMLELVTLYEMNKNGIYKSDSDMDTKNKELEALETAHHAKVGEFLSEKQFATFNTLIAATKSGS